jgi:hypothetical protein
MFFSLYVFRPVYYPFQDKNRMGPLEALEHFMRGRWTGVGCLHASKHQEPLAGNWFSLFISLCLLWWVLWKHWSTLEEEDGLVRNASMQANMRSHSWFISLSLLLFLPSVSKALFKTVSSESEKLISHYPLLGAMKSVGS